jgi:hypothetical protein
VNDRAARTVTTATALAGACVALLGSHGGSLAAGVMDARLIVPVTALALAAWGALAGASAARRGPGGGRGLRWGLLLVGATFGSSLAVALSGIASQASPSSNNLWPLNLLFAGALGAAAVGAFTVGAVVIACVTLALVGWLAAQLQARARVGEPEAARFGAWTLALLGGAKLLSDPFSTVGLLAVALAVGGVLYLGALAKARAIRVAAVALLAASVGTHALVWRQTAVVEQVAAAPRCYTSARSSPSPSTGRGAYALAAEKVAGVSAARALYTDGYHDEQTGLPRVDVAVELAPGADEAATLARVRTALAAVRCRNDDGSGGTPEMSPRVLLGRARPVAFVVEAEGAPADGLRAAVERAVDGVPVREWFATDDERRFSFRPPAVAGASWRVDGVAPGPEGLIAIALAPGEHAVVGSLDVRRAPLKIPR